MDTWTLGATRAEARRLQTLVDKGEDPREQDRAKREARETIKREQEAARTYTLAALGTSQTDNALRLALLAGGQRMEQLLRAEVKDWNASTKTLRLEDAKGRRKQARPHYLPLAPKAAALVASLAEAAKEREDKRLLPLVATTAGKRAKAISKAMGGPSFDLRDLRRTVETMLAAMGISKDTRAQLLSHGLSGVQDKHYDRHSYAEEKRAALVAWEARLEEIQTGQKPGNVVKMTRKKKTA